MNEAQYFEQFVGDEPEPIPTPRPEPVVKTAIRIGTIKPCPMVIWDEDDDDDGVLYQWSDFD